MRRARFRRPPGLVGALVLTLALPAASPASQFPQRARDPGRALENATRIPPEQEIQLFGATVSRVRVDVIVTDGDGSFVTDLGPNDFEVYEDGERQEILDVQLVDLGAGEVHPLLDGTPRGTSGPDKEEASSSGSDSADTTGPVAASELGAVIFLIDGPSLSVQARARFGDAWTQLLEQTEGLNVPRAAYMVDNAGRLQELAPLGYDLEAMRAAAETVRAAPFFGDLTRQRLIEIANDLWDSNLPDDAAQRLAAAKVRSYEGQERSRSLASYELLTSFAEALWTRSGRTALVWVSTGIKLMQGGPYATLLGDQRDSFSPDPAIHAAQEALHRTANGSNVSLYTVDPSLLSGTRFAGSDVEVTTIDASNLLSSSEVQQSIDGLRDALRSAAAETGGQSFIHATDLRMVLEEIEADTSRFYLVTYAPPSPDGDGDWHEIRVEVARDGVDVRARGGYVDHPPEERAQRLIAAALALPGSVTDLPVEAQVFRSQRPAGEPNVLMGVAVEGSEVGVMLTQAGERRVSLDIHAIVLHHGEPVGESHEQLTARSADNGTFAADGDTPLSPTLVGFLAYEHEWSLEPGDYTLNVAAFDNVSGRVGATSLGLEVPEQSDAWGISDPLLVTVDDAGRVSPIVLGRVTPGQSLAAFVEVYNGARPLLSGQVFLESAGDDPPQSAKLFAIALRRVGGNTHRGSAPLPPGMPPGRYVVQLVITDAPAQQHRVVRVPIEVVAPPQR